MDPWTFVKGNLEIIISIGIPVGLTVLSVLFKWISGESEFASLGADLSLANFSLFLAVAVGQIHLKKISASGDILTAIIFIILFLVIWWLCLALSYKTFPIYKGRLTQPYVSGAIGSVSLYFGSLLTLNNLLV